MAGRSFEDSDAADAERVALVNRQFERQFFLGNDAVGRTIMVNGAETRVVGVTEDFKVHQLGEAPVPYLFLSQRQSYSPYITFLARGTGDEDAIALGMMTTARAVDPGLLIFVSSTMQRHLGVPLLLRRMGAALVGTFALLALLRTGRAARQHLGQPGAAHLERRGVVGTDRGAARARSPWPCIR